MTTYKIDSAYSDKVTKGANNTILMELAGILTLSLILSIGIVVSVFLII